MGGVAAVRPRATRTREGRDAGDEQNDERDDDQTVALEHDDTSLVMILGCQRGHFNVHQKRLFDKSFG